MFLKTCHRSCASKHTLCQICHLSLRRRASLIPQRAGFARVNKVTSKKNKIPHPWDTHYQFSIKNSTLKAGRKDGVVVTTLLARQSFPMLTSTGCMTCDYRRCCNQCSVEIVDVKAGLSRSLCEREAPIHACHVTASFIRYCCVRWRQRQKIGGFEQAEEDDGAVCDVRQWR